VKDRLCAADQYATEWLQRHQTLVPEPAIFHRLVRSRVGSGLAWCFPRADFDRLTLIVEMVLWAMSLDRHSGEVAGTGDYPGTARSVGAAIRALDRPERTAAGADPFPRVAARIATRLRREVPPHSADRLLRTLRRFLLAKLWEVEQCAAGRLPDVAEYLAMRRHTVLAVTIIEFVEPAGRFLISEAARRDRRVRRLVDAARNVVAWTNDLRSYEWERHEGSAPPASLPTLIARRDRVDIDRAFATVGHMLDEEKRVAHRLVAELRHGTGSELRSYLFGVKIFVDYADDWHKRNPRYRLRTAATR
jgi:hypothetical protein